MRYVYFAEATYRGSPLIKIGCSSGPEMRVKQLTFDTLCPVTLLAKAPGDILLERHAHGLFADARTTVVWRDDRPYKSGGSTEWFVPTDALLAMVKHVEATGQLPYSLADTTQGIAWRRYQDGQRCAHIAREMGLPRQNVHAMINEMRRRELWKAVLASRERPTPTQTAA